MSPRERRGFVVGFHELDRVDGSELVILHVADVSAGCRNRRMYMLRRQACPRMPAVVML